MACEMFSPIWFLDILMTVTQFTVLKSYFALLLLLVGVYIVLINSYFLHMTMLCYFTKEKKINKFHYVRVLILSADIETQYITQHAISFVTELRSRKLDFVVSIIFSWRKVKSKCNISIQYNLAKTLSYLIL